MHTTLFFLPFFLWLANVWEVERLFPFAASLPASQGWASEWTRPKPGVWKAARSPIRVLGTQVLGPRQVCLGRKLKSRGELKPWAWNSFWVSHTGGSIPATWGSTSDTHGHMSGVRSPTQVLWLWKPLSACRLNPSFRTRLPLRLKLSAGKFIQFLSSKDGLLKWGHYDHFKCRLPFQVEENGQKAEYMYYNEALAWNVGNTWIVFDSKMLNYFYLRAINSLQVWVNDVLVGRIFVLGMSCSALYKFVGK